MRISFPTLRDSIGIAIIFAILGGASRSFADDPNTLVVTPDFASIAGGTSLQIDIAPGIAPPPGMSFSADCLVSIGSASCAHVALISPTELTCQAPAQKQDAVLDLSVRCLGTGASFAYRGFHAFGPLSAATTAKAISPTHSAIVAASGGLPPYRFSIANPDAYLQSNYSDCVSVDAESGLLKGNRLCTESDPLVSVQDSIGEIAQLAVPFVLDLLGPTSPIGSINDSQTLNFRQFINSGLAPFAYQVLSGPMSVDPATGLGTALGNTGSFVVQVTDAFGTLAKIQGYVIAHGYATQQIVQNFQRDDLDLLSSRLLRLGGNYLVASDFRHYTVKEKQGERDVTGDDFGITTLGPDGQNWPYTELPVSPSRQDGFKGGLTTGSGKLLLYGNSYVNSIVNFRQSVEGLIARVNPDLTADTTFGAKGFALIPIGNSTKSVIKAVMEAPDGSLLASGFSCGKKTCDPYLVVLSSSGQVRARYGLGDGYVNDYPDDFDSDGPIKSMKLLPLDSSSFLLGYAAPSGVKLLKISYADALAPNAKTLPSSGFGDFSTLDKTCTWADLQRYGASQVLAGVECDAGGKVFRYNSDGSADAAFGQKGVVDITALHPGFYSNTEALSLNLIRVQSQSGKILLSGYDNLIRLSPDGSLDQSFGQNGVMEANAADMIVESESSAIVLLPDEESRGSSIERLKL